jgi:hypothetical protein
MATAKVTSEHAEAHRALTRGGIALICNSALTSILGVVFWLVAAHLVGRADVGRGSALLSALLIVSALAQVNYGRTLSGLLPRAGNNATKVLARAYGRVVILSITLGLAFATLAPLVSSKFSYINALPAFAVLFALSVPLYSIFNLEDTVLATVRRAVIIPFENSAFGMLKIILLFALALFHGVPTSLAIVTSWTLPLIFIITPINIYLFRRGVPQAVSSFPEKLARKEGTWVRYDFVGYLFWLLGTLPLPVLAVIVLGPVSTAVFSIPFMIVGAIDVLSLNLGNQLTAELSRTRGKFKDPTVLFVWRVWGAIGALSLGMIAVAPYVLDLFGAQYRSAGTTVFRVLMLAALPRSILFLCIAATRARAASANDRRDGPIILLLQATTCILTVAISLLTTHVWGILGMALSWTIASTVGAAIAIMTVRPPVIRVLARPARSVRRRRGAHARAKPSRR